MKKEIDKTRHLCETCKKSAKCDFEGFESGDEGNVFKCKKYQKQNANKLKPRAEKGSPFFHFAYIDENDFKKGYKSVRRIEQNNRLDNLFYEVGNYFLTDNECLTAISKLKSCTTNQNQAG